VKFSGLELPDAQLIDLEPIRDERGLFARTWCEQEFADHGIDVRFVQANLSYNRRRGTLRGMHYQVPPHEEPKLVHCIAGSVYDVIVDLRSESPGFLKWIALQLTARAGRLLYVPAGFAHGFQALEDDTQVLYLMGAPYVAEAARGIRWDDPRLGISWPIPELILSERDRSFPDLDPETLRLWGAGS
jgi:dTDP-4-dehydrorhamnose 3,5-epimerase